MNLYDKKAFVYILRNGNKYYVGMANNIWRRFEEHKAGESPMSSSIGPLDSLELYRWWLINWRGRTSQIERYLQLVQSSNIELFLELIELDDILVVEDRDDFKLLPLPKVWEWQHKDNQLSLI